MTSRGPGGKLQVSELQLDMLPSSEREILERPVVTADTGTVRSMASVAVETPASVERMRALTKSLRAELGLIKSGAAPLGSPVGRRNANGQNRGKSHDENGVSLPSIGGGGGGKGGKRRGRGKRGAGGAGGAGAGDAFEPRPHYGLRAEDAEHLDSANEAAEAREEDKYEAHGLDVRSDQPMTATEIRRRHESLLALHAALNEEHRKLKAELRMRQDSYLRREAKLKVNLDALRIQVERMVTARGAADGPMVQLRATVSAIQAGMNTVSERAGKIVEQHKAEVEHIARAKLAAMQRELDAVRARSDNVEFEWLERCAALERKLDWTNEQAVRLNSKNEFLAQENATLQREYGAQKESVGQLQRQLLATRKESDRLREIFGETGYLEGGEGGSAGLPGLPSGPDAPALVNAGAAGSGASDAEMRRLRMALQREKQMNRALRSDNAGLLNSRTELEVFLRRAIDVVKEDILTQKKGFFEETFAEATGAAGDSRAKAASEVRLGDFTAGDRDKVLEILLSKERVLTLLYGRIFGPIDQQDVLATVLDNTTDEQTSAEDLTFDTASIAADGAGQRLSAPAANDSTASMFPENEHQRGFASVASRSVL